jgi:uncharacterized small protein (DUF1192 family)
MAFRSLFSDWVSEIEAFLLTVNVGGGFLNTDDLEPRAKQDAPLHTNLDDYSIEELKERIGALGEEIARCEAAIKARQSTRESADAVFR